MYLQLSYENNFSQVLSNLGIFLKVISKQGASSTITHSPLTEMDYILSAVRKEAVHIKLTLSTTCYKFQLWSFLEHSEIL